MHLFQSLDGHLELFLVANLLSLLERVAERASFVYGSDQPIDTGYDNVFCLALSNISIPSPSIQVVW